MKALAPFPPHSRICLQSATGYWAILLGAFIIAPGTVETSGACGRFPETVYGRRVFSFRGGWGCNDCWASRSLRWRSSYVRNETGQHTDLTAGTGTEDGGRGPTTISRRERWFLRLLGRRTRCSPPVQRPSRRRRLRRLRGSATRAREKTNSNNRNDRQQTDHNA